MTDPDILETIANAIGTGINSRAANETDREFDVSGKPTSGVT